MKYATHATLRYGDDGEAEFDLEVEHGDGRVYAVTGWRTKWDGLKRKHVRVGEAIDFTPLVSREVLWEQIQHETRGTVERIMYREGV